MCITHPDNFKGEIYNVGTGDAYTVNQIADMFGGEKQYGEKRIEPKYSIAENAKIRLDLGWKTNNDLKNFIKIKTMNEIDNILPSLLGYLKENKPKYLYNQAFVPGKSQVLYSGPYWDEEEIMAAIKTFIEGKWVVAGENVNKFERKFGKLFGAKFVQMVNSGSSANLVLMSALKKYFGWEDGDEIIVSPVGFPTTISVIVQNNLTPVFVDIEYDTLNFDITKIEEKITLKLRLFLYLRY